MNYKESSSLIFYIHSDFHMNFSIGTSKDFTQNLGVLLKNKVVPTLGTTTVMITPAPLLPKQLFSQHIIKVHIMPLPQVCGHPLCYPHMYIHFWSLVYCLEYCLSLTYSCQNLHNDSGQRGFKALRMLYALHLMDMELLSVKETVTG